MTPFEKLQRIYDTIRLSNDEPREQDGLNAAQVSDAFEKVGLKPLPVLRQLYEWHNGVGYLLGFLCFDSLEICIEKYQLLCKGGESEKLKKGSKPPGFLFLTSTETSPFALTCRAAR